MLNNIRIEEDLLGTREVPADAYYGVHTLRAIENFYISNNKISDIPEFVRGMVMVKKAAAQANKELQTIPKSVANAIIAACDEVLNNGKCMDQFPVDVFQGGAGTSVNMNTNEVLANIGLELMGHQKGEYQYLNPNDHVNKCQSTNDAYPTGFRIAVYASILKLIDAINQLGEGFQQKAVEFQDILKMGRTQLQDAVPMTLGQEFHAFNVLLNEETKCILRTAELLLEVNLGATAIGTRLNTPDGYQQQQPQEIGKEPRQKQQQTGDNQRHAFDHLCGRALPRRHLLLHQHEVFKALVFHQRYPHHRAEDHQNQRQQNAKHMSDLDKDRDFNVNV